MSTDQRLNRLEQENKIHRGLWGAALLIGIAAVVWGQAQGIPDVIQALKFEGVNKRGRET